MVKFDQIDLRILSELSNEANISIPKLSEKMNVNMSVVYSRIKRLIDKGFIKKYTLEINEETSDVYRKRLEIREQNLQAIYQTDENREKIHKFCLSFFSELNFF